VIKLKRFKECASLKYSNIISKVKLQPILFCYSQCRHHAECRYAECRRPKCRGALCLSGKSEEKLKLKGKHPH
jgi:hypothetical protein